MGGEVLPVNAPSPPYAAVIEWLPEPSADVVQVALPGNETAAVPSWVAPSKKVIVPVGYPMKGGGEEIVAVSTIDCPGDDGLDVDVTATDVEFLTTCVRLAEWLGLNAESPS
jgi:hypothetical protein